MTKRNHTRRSFLQSALAGGAAGTAYLMLGKDMYVRAEGPIVIGHQCDLTGGFSSWGYWHDKCATTAVEFINGSGGIAGRKVELETEDTESSQASGACKLRSLIQRRNAGFVAIGRAHVGTPVPNDQTGSRL